MHEGTDQIPLQMTMILVQYTQNIAPHLALQLRFPSSKEKQIPSRMEHERRTHQDQYPSAQAPVQSVDYHYQISLSVMIDSELTIKILTELLTASCSDFQPPVCKHQYTLYMFSIHTHAHARTHTHTHAQMHTHRDAHAHPHTEDTQTRQTHRQDRHTDRQMDGQTDTCTHAHTNTHTHQWLEIVSPSLQTFWQQFYVQEKQ